MTRVVTNPSRLLRRLQVLLLTIALQQRVVGDDIRGRCHPFQQPLCDVHARTRDAHLGYSILLIAPNVSTQTQFPKVCTKNAPLVSHDTALCPHAVLCKQIMRHQHLRTTNYICINLWTTRDLGKFLIDPRSRPNTLRPRRSCTRPCRPQ